MSEEADPNKEQEGGARDFEGRWQAAHSSESGDLDFECGNCAEHLLWLELSPQLISLPKDDELLELLATLLWLTRATQEPLLSPPKRIN